MTTVILAVHLILAIALVCVVLLQKSEGGALGMGGGGMSGFMTGRSTANLLTRTTAILAALFFITSIALAYLTANQRTQRSILDLPAMAPTAPVSSSPGTTTPAKPAAPAKPASPASGTATSPAPAPATPAEPSAPLGK